MSKIMQKTSAKCPNPTGWVILMFAALMISSCSSMTSTPRISVEVNERWALLPIRNLSETSQADLQAQGMIETQLRARGVTSIDTYSPVRQVSLRNLLDPDAQILRAKAWAEQSSFRYALTGSVNEWHYKAGADREPAVGLSLKLIDLKTDTVIWQANAARTGWGYANLPTVANKLISELLTEVQLHSTSQ